MSIRIYKQQGSNKMKTLISTYKCRNNTIELTWDTHHGEYVVRSLHDGEYKWLFLESSKTLEDAKNYFLEAIAKDLTLI